MDGATCKGCIFWDAHSWGGSGLCRVNAPRVGEFPWPQTSEDDWCGEFSDGRIRRITNESRRRRNGLQ
jgi:hypothetical protein